MWTAGRGSRLSDFARALALALVAVSATSAVAQTQFFSVAPCRVLDTRTPVGPLGGPLLNPGATRIFTIEGVCNVPAGASVVSVNVTVTNQTSAGFLQLYSGDSPAPGTSVLSFSPGKTRADNALVALPADGAGGIAIRNVSSGVADVVLDVNGYFSNVGVASDGTVTIIATSTLNKNWTFVPSNVSLKVGQTYTITWTTPAAEAKTHGVGGLAALGITQCDVIRFNQPCTVSFTPTAAMLNFPGPVYTYGCSQSQCAPSQALHDGMQGTVTIVP